ncbi:MAG: metal-sensitive transcriptional regulator [Chloroflexi bacterium]|nr:metal-sensitive transcriptional regulator [Chloroflexota bacterium]MBU1749976.1 metal-sensitive transcriptional regulator [Chloroflexota bacterium]MBU1877893.1 metal-sensitive transcriptional regulator [Chloroflexota bacterium]
MSEQTDPVVNLDPEIEAGLMHRLRRLEGQVRGVQRMVQDGRGCQDIIVQLTAIRSAVDQVGLILLENQMHRCLPPSDTSQQEATRLRETLHLWTRFQRG